MRHIAALTVALALLTGCGMFDDDTETELLRNYQRWKSLDIHDYDFRFQRSCFCGGVLDPVIVEVRGDTISVVRHANTGEVVYPGPFPYWPTVDSLFVWTLRRFDQDYELSITYDPTYRFPALVIGDLPRVIDDEFTNTASNLVER